MRRTMHGRSAANWRAWLRTSKQIETDLSRGHGRQPERVYVFWRNVGLFIVELP